MRYWWSQSRYKFKANCTHLGMVSLPGSRYSAIWIQKRQTGTKTGNGFNRKWKSKVEQHVHGQFNHSLSAVLTPAYVCMCWSLYVSECVCKSCSNWRVREDSLIQLSSVDSFTNPLHLLKHPPQKIHPSPFSMCLCWESLGPGCASAFVSTPVIVSGLAPLP